MKIGLEVRPSFSIAPNKRCVKCLEAIKVFFDCGGIRFCKRDQTFIYEVRTLSNLNTFIIPHFKKYPLYTHKKEDLIKFTRICYLMKKNLHLSCTGILEIIDIACTMNVSGKRKYNKEQLLKILKF